MKVVIYKRLHVTGMAIWPFILLKANHLKNNKKLINHERIHHRQQLELLIIPFYFLYFLSYLINLYRFKDHYRAYENIVFEIEAYQNEANLDYLKERKFLNWRKYL